MSVSMQEFFYPGTYVEGDPLDAIMSDLNPHFYSPTQHIVPASLARNAPKVKKIVPPMESHKRQPLKDDVALVPTSLNRPEKRSATDVPPKAPLNRQPLKGGVPPGCDSLFWTIYQHMCAQMPDKYTTFGLQPLMAQTTEKSRIIAWIQENPKRFQTALAEHRITKARVQEILTQLLTGGANSVDCLMAYVAYYGISVVAWYPQNRTYCNFTPLGKMEEGGDIVVEYCGRRWKLCERDGDAFLENAVKLKHYVGEGGSALGSESSYKKEELVKMGRILGIEVEGLGKKELYEKINICCYTI